MTRQMKFIVDTCDFDSARTVAGCFGETLEPLAVTMFEATLPRHRVEAYFDADSMPAVSDVEDLLRGAGLSVLITTDVVPDENWIAISQAALPPVEAGRFVIFGGHDAARVGRRMGGIQIDAGEAFGTAHHATTLGCLLALERVARFARPRRILDLGSGTGVLAIAASRVFPQSRVVASDIDPIATDVATANVRLNGAAGRITCLTANGVTNAALRRPFDLIVANILAGPLTHLAPDLRRTLRLRGHAVLSGLLPEQAPQVIATYRAQGFQLIRRTDLTGWSILHLQRRS